MEITRSDDGTTITVKMTVGEGIALRDQLASVVGRSPKSGELKRALEQLIPQKLVLLESPRKGRKK